MKILMDFMITVIPRFRITVFVLFFMQALFSPLYGQMQNLVMPEAKPVSPASAAMFKVLEHPIGTATGTIPVSFDLFSISQGNLTIPIKLDYNSTGGVKVEEVAAPVGLGFSLPVVGRITRIQNGISDEDYYGRLRNSLKPSAFNPVNSFHLERAHLREFDSAPDVFMFYLNGNMGKFMFDENRNIVMLQESEIKVVARISNDNIARLDWDLYDKDGNKYMFSSGEMLSHSTTNGSTTGPGSSYISGWKLDSVMDYNGTNKIRFEYETNSMIYVSHGLGFTKVLVYDSNGCQWGTNEPGETTVTTVLDESIIKKVSGSFGSIDFQYTNDRRDMQGYGGKRLRSIIQYNADSERVKKIKFNFGYFGSSAPLGEYYDTYRLKLLNFSEYGINDNDSLTHTFQYVEKSLPHRLTKSVDLWGYYNGKINTTRFPKMIIEYNGSTVDRNDLGDRDADANVSDAHVLRKISYPTGGTREIFYEGNTALPSLDDQYQPSTDLISKSFAFQLNNGIGNPYEPQASYVFDINTTDPSVTFQGQFTLYGGAGFRIEIKDWQAGTEPDWGGYSAYLTEYTQTSFSVQLAPGRYRVDVYLFSGYDPSNLLECFWTERNEPVIRPQITIPHGQFYTENRPVGGIRVKKISDFDPATSQVTSTHYKYKMYSIDSTLTSGLLNTPVRLINEYNGGDCFLCSYLMLFSGPTYPLAMEGGSYVFYPEVRTVQTNGGWIDKSFAYVSDILPGAEQYPMPPVINPYSGYRGKLLKEKFFNASGNLVREKEYEYGQIALSSSDIKGKMIQLFYQYSGQCMDYSSGQLPTRYPRVIEYSYIDHITALSAEQERSYAPTGTTTERTEYSYENDNGIPMISKTKQIKSNGDILEEFYKYPRDANSEFHYGLSPVEAAAKSVMHQRHLRRPIEIVTKITKPGGVSITNGKKYAFGNFGSDRYHLSNVKDFAGGQESQSVSFLNYTHKGKILERRNGANRNEVFVWGYGGEYPIAKIENATYLEVLSVIGQLGIDALNSFTVNDATINNIMAALRSHPTMAKAQVSNYTYDLGSGMTSMTDPRGITEYYQYDGFQRLKNVLDFESNILRDYRYNYRP